MAYYPSRYPIRRKQGAFFRLRLRRKYKASGEPVPMPGHAGRMDVRDNTGTLRFRFDTAGGEFTTPDDEALAVGDMTVHATSGEILCESAVVTALPVGEYRYDLRLTNAAGEKAFTVEGTFTVTRSETV